jgi:hypothetical protein
VTTVLIVAGALVALVAVAIAVAARRLPPGMPTEGGTW